MTKEEHKTNVMLIELEKERFEEEKKKTENSAVYFGSKARLNDLKAETIELKNESLRLKNEREKLELQKLRQTIKPAAPSFILPNGQRLILKPNPQ